MDLVGHAHGQLFLRVSAPSPEGHTARKKSEPLEDLHPMQVYLCNGGSRGLNVAL